MAARGRAHGVEGLKIVPTHLEALLTGADAAGVLPRRRLVLGGDRTEWSLVERVHALAPGCEVFNHYGPTETTVGVLAQKLERGEKRAGTNGRGARTVLSPCRACHPCTSRACGIRASTLHCRCRP